VLYVAVTIPKIKNDFSARYEIRRRISFFTGVRATCRKQFSLFWLPRVVDFKAGILLTDTAPCLRREANPRPVGELCYARRGHVCGLLRA
jgi:hypothetical protein